jgi:hypothetical protein
VTTLTIEPDQDEQFKVLAQRLQDLYLESGIRPRKAASSESQCLRFLINRGSEILDQYAEQLGL